ncbi:hypothetical protein PVAP13_6NG016818 [Panicum virgatum]|uniref:No apical meristem-associated C-terminal domain-containing protein n=1 Tax=Panicum virgatum TaxID=38727 RepID=A0A8T0QSW6_PANVG|nr:hypothetical protein PVAP13_6NG016818 [Panicum virgatum]
MAWTVGLDLFVVVSSGGELGEDDARARRAGFAEAPNPTQRSRVARCRTGQDGARGCPRNSSPPPPATSKKGKDKKVSRRGSNFTTEEDAVICSVWLNVTTNAAIGCNQTEGGFYKRIHTYFKQNKPQGSERSQIAIQGRWKSIQKAVSKFCAFKAIIDRRNESGKNEADRIEDAVKMFEDKEPFHFMDCWKILKDQAKWNDKLLEHSGGNATTDGNTVDSQGPEGRDSAKRRNKRAAESEASTAVEVLQRIHDNREKNQANEDDQLEQILARKDEKLSLQREILQMKKQAREEDLQLRKQETELRAKQTEAQLMTAEAGIMGVDLEKVAPHLKDYYIGMQRQIMERR